MNPLKRLLTATLCSVVLFPALGSGGDSDNRVPSPKADPYSACALLPSIHGDSAIFVRRMHVPEQNLIGGRYGGRFEISLADLPSTGSQTVKAGRAGRTLAVYDEMLAVPPRISAARSDSERTTLLAIQTSGGAPNIRLLWIPDSGGQDSIVSRKMFGVLPRGQVGEEKKLAAPTSPFVLHFGNGFVITGDVGTQIHSRIWAGKAANITKGTYSALEQAAILGNGEVPVLFEHGGRLYCLAVSRTGPRTPPGTGWRQKVVGWVSADGDNWAEWKPGVPLDAVDALKVYADETEVYLACWDTGPSATVNVFKMTDAAKGFERAGALPPGPGQSASEAVGIRKKDSQIQILHLSRDNNEDSLRIQRVE